MYVKNVRKNVRKIVRKILRKNVRKILRKNVRKILRKNVRKILRKNVCKILRKNVRKILRKNEVNYYTLPPKERTEMCLEARHVPNEGFFCVLRTFSIYFYLHFYAHFTYIFYVKIFYVKNVRTFCKKWYHNSYKMTIFNVKLRILLL